MMASQHDRLSEHPPSSISDGWAMAIVTLVCVALVAAIAGAQ